jgi:hypothetical protein|tara:strand:+ start:432 stop:920 length:489 start_codon:yes stop_codon:yes gene_type:complete
MPPKKFPVNTDKDAIVPDKFKGRKEAKAVIKAFDKKKKKFMTLPDTGEVITRSEHELRGLSDMKEGLRQAEIRNEIPVVKKKLQQADDVNDEIKHIKSNNKIYQSIPDKKERLKAKREDKVMRRQGTVRPLKNTIKMLAGGRGKLVKKFLDLAKRVAQSTDN